MSCPITMRSLENADPFPAYEALRSQGPVVWDESLKGWLVLDFELCRHVEFNEATQFRNMYADADPLIVELKGGAANITVSQGEQHQRMRRFHQTPAVAQGAAVLSRPVRHAHHPEHARSRARQGGSADLAADFGDEIPPRVICALLGMPWQDDGLIRKTLELNEEIMKWIGRGYYDEASVRDARAASAAINEILLPFIRERRERRRMISSAACGAKRRTNTASSPKPTHSPSVASFISAAPTPPCTASRTRCICSLWNPEMRAAVERDREQIAGVIEEAQRLFGSPQWRYRRANQDCELGGVEVKKDQMIVLLHGAANRDPKRFRRMPRQPGSCATETARSPHIQLRAAQLRRHGTGARRNERRAEWRARSSAECPPDTNAEPPRFANLFMRSFRPLHVRFDS